MPWQEDARPLTWTKQVVTISVGGTAQSLALGSSAPYTPVRGFNIINPSLSTSESLWFEPNPDVNGPAVAGQSMEIPAGGNIYFGPASTINNTAPSILGATGGHVFVVYVGR